jgi:hypothetical protein
LAVPPPAAVALRAARLPGRARPRARPIRPIAAMETPFVASAERFGRPPQRRSIYESGNRAANTHAAALVTMASALTRTSSGGIRPKRPGDGGSPGVRTVREITSEHRKNGLTPQ